MTERDATAGPRRRAQPARAAGTLERGRQPKPGSPRCSAGRSKSAPAAAWSAGCGPLISAASSRSATSTGAGPSAATAPPSRR